VPLPYRLDNGWVQDLDPHDYPIRRAEPSPFKGPWMLYVAIAGLAIVLSVIAAFRHDSTTALAGAVWPVVPLAIAVYKRRFEQ
jgi:hypothetical protein